LIHSSTALKDAFNRTGLKNISLIVQDSHQKLETPFYFQKFKGLKPLHLSLRMLMMRMCLPKNN